MLLTLHHYLFHMSSSKLGMVLGNDECLKVSYCVGDSWSHEKLPVCASEFTRPKSLHSSVMHNAHFIVPPVHCYTILTQHPHHLHPLLREHMRPDFDAWHSLWRGSQHAWWSCLQVLCLPFLISKAHEETWFQPIRLFFLLQLTMAWTAGTDATKESQCLGLNLSTVMETLGMDRWDKTGYFLLGFIKIYNYLFFLNVIARCQSALLHLLPLHLSCLLTGFLRPWYVINGDWPLEKFWIQFLLRCLGCHPSSALTNTVFPQGEPWGRRSDHLSCKDWKPRSWSAGKESLGQIVFASNFYIFS